MADQSWYQHLAEATFTGSHWQVNDPGAVESKANRKVALALDELYMRMQEAVEVFNHYARAERAIKLLRVSSDPTSEGFILLQGANQLHVRCIEGVLHVSITMQIQFQSKTSLMARFTPSLDVFGGVSWSSETVKHLQIEQIVKLMLQEFCRVFDQGSSR